MTTLARNEPLTDRIMSLGRIRHMPVLDEDGRLCGVVSQRELFRGALARALGFGVAAQNKILETLLVKDVMATDVRSAAPDMPIREAARIMQERKIGCLPVVDGEKLVGIVTESDFVAFVARKAGVAAG